MLTVNELFLLDNDWKLSSVCRIDGTEYKTFDFVPALVRDRRVIAFEHHGDTVVVMAGL